MVRQTTTIGRKAGSSLLHSVRTAKAIGRDLNTFITINFWELGSSENSIFWDFAKLRSEWFLRWSRYEPKRGGTKNGVPTWTYVHEAPNGLAHTHWLAHINSENVCRFKIALEKQIQKQFSLSALPSGALHIENVYNGEGLKLYLAKGIQPMYGDLWGIRHEDMGSIAHRRADTSRNIGPSVRVHMIAKYKQRRAALHKQPSLRGSFERGPTSSLGF